MAPVERVELDDAQPCLLGRRSAIVLLPEPVVPMTTTRRICDGSARTQPPRAYRQPFVRPLALRPSADCSVSGRARRGCRHHVDRALMPKFLFRNLNLLDPR